MSLLSKWIISKYKYKFNVEVTPSMLPQAGPHSLPATSRTAKAQTLPGSVLVKSKSGWSFFMSYRPWFQVLLERGFTSPSFIPFLVNIIVKYDSEINVSFQSPTEIHLPSRFVECQELWWHGGTLVCHPSHNLKTPCSNLDEDWNFIKFEMIWDLWNS